MIGRGGVEVVVVGMEHHLAAEIDPFNQVLFCSSWASGWSGWGRG